MAGTDVTTAAAVISRLNEGYEKAGGGEGVASPVKGVCHTARSLGVWTWISLWTWISPLAPPGSGPPGPAQASTHSVTWISRLDPPGSGPPGLLASTHSLTSFRGLLTDFCTNSFGHVGTPTHLVTCDRHTNSFGQM